MKHLLNILLTLIVSQNALAKGSGDTLPDYMNKDVYECVTVPHIAHPDIKVKMTKKYFRITNVILEVYGDTFFGLEQLKFDPFDDQITLPESYYQTQLLSNSGKNPNISHITLTERESSFYMATHYTDSNEVVVDLLNCQKAH